jgi:Lamin Tail Domain
MKKACLLLFCLFTKYLPAQNISRYDIVISEIFPDPTPSVGLPNSEFLELTNISDRSINLDKWKISDGNSTATIAGPFMLQADSQVIICPRAFINSFNVFGASIGVSAFPSLDNSGDVILLISPEGKTVHAISYKPEWYRNQLKQEGGWSLEMIDLHMPCKEADNWVASRADKGGSPGKMNSVNAVLTDKTPPILLRSYTIDSLTVAAVFNESLDSNFSVILQRYDIWPDIGRPFSASLAAPFFKEVLLHLSTPLRSTQVYLLRVKESTDCAGNTSQEQGEVKTGIPLHPNDGQLRINEILFDPRPGGVDYVELLNRGPGILNLQNIYIGNQRNGPSGNLKKCSENPFLLFPGEFYVLTENSDIVEREYSVKDRQHLLSLSEMPSYPDDQGSVLIMDSQGRELDLFEYKDDYHFPLLSNREGVSLERINPAGLSQDPANWQSAATDAGYGTPGYVNSQFRPEDPVEGEINISPLTFSPDQDGHDDQLTIQYKFPGPGYTCSIIIFDHRGRPVRYLVRNNLCGTSGYFRWNGLDEKTHALPAGVYYLVTEIFNLEGKRKIIKRGIVLAYKM